MIYRNFIDFSLIFFCSLSSPMKAASVPRPSSRRMMMLEGDKLNKMIMNYFLIVYLNHLGAM